MKKTLMALGCAAALLGGCGGGDDDEPPVTAQVPQSANQTVGGFIAYLKALVVSPADTLEPVDTGAVTPPTSETAEPTVVD